MSDFLEMTDVQQIRTNLLATIKDKAGDYLPTLRVGQSVKVRLPFTTTIVLVVRMENDYIVTEYNATERFDLTDLKK